MREKLKGLAKEILSRAIVEWKRDSNFGSDFWCGHNGPYNHYEPPLRSLCHYGCLATLVVEDNLNEDIDYFLDAINKYVMSCIKQPLVFRDEPDQDYGNGVIGAAWMMEFVRYSQSLTDTQKNTVYKFVQREFIFDAEKSIYSRQSSDASFGGGVDATFNHQLWFVTELSLSPFGHENIENINETIKAYCYNDTYFDNTIYHKFTIGGRQSGLKYLFKRLKYYPKSVSYNLFNMMAIKRLLKSGVLDDENSQWLTHLSEWKIRFWHVPVLAFEKHGVSYNPVALEAISCQTPMTSMLFTRQFQMYKNILNEGNGCHNSIDAPRLLSRIYEVLT